MTKAEREKWDELIAAINKFRDVLFGNGEIGYCERVRTIESKLKSHLYKAKKAPKTIFDYIFKGVQVMNIVILLYIAITTFMGGK